MRKPKLTDTGDLLKTTQLISGRLRTGTSPQDGNGLLKSFGYCLAQHVVEVAKVQPSGPIEYLAHWLIFTGKSLKQKKNH